MTPTVANSEMPSPQGSLVMRINIGSKTATFVDSLDTLVRMRDISREKLAKSTCSLLRGTLIQNALKALASSPLGSPADTVPSCIEDVSDPYYSQQMAEYFESEFSSTLEDLDSPTFAAADSLDHRSPQFMDEDEVEDEDVDNSNDVDEDLDDDNEEARHSVLADEARNDDDDESRRQLFSCYADHVQTFEHPARKMTRRNSIDVDYDAADDDRTYLPTCSVRNDSSFIHSHSDNTDDDDESLARRPSPSRCSYAYSFKRRCSDDSHSPKRRRQLYRQSAVVEA